MKTPCLGCDELTTNPSRCDDCQQAWNRLQARAQESRTRPSRGRGYNWQWDKLSSRARALQPFCSHCGTTHDLQADHTPEAWRRRAAGLRVRLQDIQVLCGRCNRMAGDARPGSQRAERERKAPAKSKRRTPGG